MTSALEVSPATSDKFQAFISYSRGASADLAASLQTGLEQFAKPWYRLRAMRVFRDDASMSANTQLWSTIEDALRQAEWFVLLASPEAAESVWVNKEITWWRQNRDPNRILLVQASGEISWDYGTNEFSISPSSAIPKSLIGAYREEPRWIDMRWFSESPELASADPRFDERLADIAATVRGVPRDRLVGENVKLHRRAMRLARFAVVVLVILLLISAVAGVMAAIQARKAESQLQISVSRLLSAKAQGEMESDIESARLYAVESFRLNEDDQSRSALLSAAASAPELIGNFHTESSITVTAGSSDGLMIVGGTDAGDVFLWNTASRERSSLGNIGSGVSGLVMSENGAIVVASSPTATKIWRAGKELQINLPRIDTSNYQARLAVSPSGGRTAISVTESDPTEQSFYGVAKVYVIDNESGDLVSSGTFPQPASDITMPNEDTITAWLGVQESADSETRTVAGFDLVAAGYGGAGVPRYLVGDLSKDGSSLVLPNNGSGAFPVYKTDVNHAGNGEGFGGSPTRQSQAIAISPDGTRLAVSDAGVITVSTVSEIEAESKVEAVLKGVPDVKTGTLHFLDNRKIIAGTAGYVSLWDLDRTGGVQTARNAKVSMPCSACGPQDLHVSSDGRYAAWEDSLDGLMTAEVGTGETYSIPNEDFSPVYRFLAWKDSSRFYALNVRDNRISMFSATEDLPDAEWDASYLAEDPLSSEPIVAHYDSSGDRLKISYSGDLYILDGSSGELLNEGPIDLESISFSGDGRTVVGVADSGTWVLQDVETGEQEPLELGSEVGTSYQSVVFSNGLLKVMEANGDVSLRDPRDAGRVALVEGSAGVGNWVSVAPDEKYLAHYESNGSISLQSLAGNVLASFPLPRNAGAKPQISFSPDGNSLIVLVSTFDNEDFPDGALINIGLEVENWERSACSTVGRVISETEWRDLTGVDTPEDYAC